MTDSYEIVMKRLPEHEQGFEAAVIYDDGIGDEQLILNESSAETLGDVITVTVVSGDQVNGAGEEVAIPHRSRTR